MHISDLLAKLVKAQVNKNSFIEQLRRGGSNASEQAVTKSEIRSKYRSGESANLTLFAKNRFAQSFELVVPQGYHNFERNGRNILASACAGKRGNSVAERTLCIGTMHREQCKV